MGIRIETMIFEDRREAGRRLAGLLTDRGYGGRDTVVLGIPRGGLVVADEIARALYATLDVVIARKLRAPDRPELGIGAVVEGDHVSVNEELSRKAGATPEYLEREIAFQKEEIARRLRLYREGRPAPAIFGKTVIVVDDGIATGYTLRAALEHLRKSHPDRLTAAAPVASLDGAEGLKAVADEVVCLNRPVSFAAVGDWYRNFDPVSEGEAAAILGRYRTGWSQAA